MCSLPGSKCCFALALCSRIADMKGSGEASREGGREKRSAWAQRPSAHPTQADLSSAKPASFGEGGLFQDLSGEEGATFSPKPGLRMGVFYGGEFLQ